MVALTARLDSLAAVSTLTLSVLAAVNTLTLSVLAAVNNTLTSMSVCKYVWSLGSHPVLDDGNFVSCGHGSHGVTIPRSPWPSTSNTWRRCACVMCLLGW